MRRKHLQNCKNYLEIIIEIEEDQIYQKIVNFKKITKKK
jgi:hypothetical protein